MLYMHALTTKFIVPLNNACVDCSVIVDAMVDYAKRYLDLSEGRLQSYMVETFSII
jgi:hypothetical protein